MSFASDGLHLFEIVHGVRRFLLRGNQMEENREGTCASCRAERLTHGNGVPRYYAYVRAKRSEFVRIAARVRSVAARIARPRRARRWDRHAQRHQHDGPNGPQETQ
jgi:hypothetical protein